MYMYIYIMYMYRYLRCLGFTGRLLAWVDVCVYVYVFVYVYVNAHVQCICIYMFVFVYCFIGLCISFFLMCIYKAVHLEKFTCLNLHRNRQQLGGGGITRCVFDNS